MKQLLSRLLLLAPLGLLLVGVNYKVDPANLFSGGTYERGVADLLIKGQHVTNLRNYDERLLQKLYLTHMPARRPVLVVGSSRAMLIGENLFPAGSIINGAVSGGVVEDMLAVYHLYTARGWKPDTLVIGLDPWMLNDNHGQERWKTLATEAAEMRRQLSTGDDAPAEGEEGGMIAASSTLVKLGELVSLSYFQNATKVLRDPSRKPSAYRATTQPVNDDFTKHPDGTITYDRNFREQDAEADAKDYIARKPVYSLGTFTGLSGTYRRQLERLVAQARQQGTTVIFFLAPYHPTVWRFVQATSEYQYVPRAEAWYRTLAAKQNVRVIGSFDPAPFGLTSTDFYDGMHCKPEVVVRLFRSNASVSARVMPPSAPTVH